MLVRYALWNLLNTAISKEVPVNYFLMKKIRLVLENAAKGKDMVKRQYFN